VTVKAGIPARKPENGLKPWPDSASRFKGLSRQFHFFADLIADKYLHLTFLIGMPYDVWTMGIPRAFFGWDLTPKGASRQSHWRPL